MSDPHGASDPPSGENPLAAEKDNVEATQNQLDTFLLLNPFEQAKKKPGVPDAESDTIVGDSSNVRFTAGANADALFALEKSGSSASRDFLGPAWRIAQFADASNPMDIHLHPRKLAQNWKGATLRVRIAGGDIDPVLRFELAVRDPANEDAIIHKAYLEFSACTPDEFKQYLWSAIAQEDSSSKTEDPGKGKSSKKKARNDYRIAFSTLGGVGCGLDYRHPAFNNETKEALEYMQSLVKDADNSKERRVNVMIAFFAPKTPEANLHQVISSLPPSNKLPWSPYRGAKGRPFTQYGAFISRSKVKEFTKNAVISYPSRHFFSSLDEGMISLTYGSMLEHRHQAQLFDHLANRVHSGFFLNIGGRSILANVRLNLEDLPEVLEESISMKEGTTVKLEWRSEGMTIRKPHSCTAVVIPNMFGLPYSDVIMSVIGKSVKYFKNFAIGMSDDPKYYTLRVSVQANEAGVKHQVDAINSLCLTTNMWQDVFLNHSSQPPTVNPTKCLELSSEKIQEIMSKILNNDRISLNLQQKSCIEGCLAMPGGVSMIQGFPGCGKTFILSAMAKLFLSTGMHVILAAPTNTAADAFCERFSQCQELMDFDKVTPIRAYAGANEMNAFFKENRDHRSNAPEHDSGNTVDETTLVMLHLITMFKTKVFDSKRALPAMSVEAMAVKIAEENTRELMTPYPVSIELRHRPKKKVRLYDPDGGVDIELVSDDEETDRESIDNGDEDEGGAIASDRNAKEEISSNEHAKKDIPSEKHSDNLQPQDSDETKATSEPGTPVNMVSELHKYLSLMKESDPKIWKDEDQAKAKFAFKKICELVLMEARVIASTNNNLGSELIRKHFGRDANGIVIFRDEDPKELEASGWIGLTKMANSEKVKGMVLAGDIKQLQPTAISATARVRTNEFASQVTTSLSARLLQANFPSIKLVQQHRMRASLVEFPNHRVHHGEMRNAKSCASIHANHNFTQMMQTWLEEKRPGMDTAHVVLDVVGSNCLIENGSKSRYNPANVRIVVELLIQNYQCDGYKVSDICVVTPYKTQKTKIRRALFEQSKAGRFPKEAHPRIETVDKVQGEEFEFVILDFVVNDASSRSGMGFTRDENRCTVAFTRAKSALVTLLPTSLLENAVTANRDDGSTRFYKAKDLFVVEYLKYMCKQASVYTMTPKDLGLKFLDENPDEISEEHDHQESSVSAENTSVAVKENASADVNISQSISDKAEGKDTWESWGNSCELPSVSAESERQSAPPGAASEYTPTDEDGCW